MKSSTIIFLLSFLFIACHNSSNKAPFLSIHGKDTVVKKDTITNIDTASKKTLQYQQEEYLNSPYDTIGILTKFFDPDSIIDNIALWVPDEDARNNMNVSEDEYCHTNIDTIFKIYEDNRTDYLIIFTTFYYDENGTISGCHSCGANYGLAVLWPINLSTGDMVNENDSTTAHTKYYIKYRVAHFMRNFTSSGCWGEKADISLADFGEKVLHISSGYTGTGANFNDEYYFEPDDGTLIFNYQSSTDTHMMCDSSSGEYEETDRELKILPLKKGQGWNDLKLKCKFTRFDTMLHRDVDSFYAEYYRMNEESGNSYQRVLKL